MKERSVLDVIRGIKAERWEVENSAGSRPRIWTAIRFEGDASNADMIAERLSRSLSPHRWCGRISTGKRVYVVFPDKVYKYRPGDVQSRKAAQEHARSLGIPERQLDWDD